MSVVFLFEDALLNERPNARDGKLGDLNVIEDANPPMAYAVDSGEVPSCQLASQGRRIGETFQLDYATVWG